MRLFDRSFVLAVLAYVALAASAGAPPAHAAFEPQVSVTISDDTPLSHPDITTTIDIPAGPVLARVETITPTGGGILHDAEMADGAVVGFIAGFSTIRGADGVCNQRYQFNAPLLKETADASAFPPFLRELAPGRHVVRFAADVAGTPVNMIVDEVRIAGQMRLRTTTYIGDPAQPPPPNCTPFRTRLLLQGMSGDIPITAAPPTPGPRVYEFTLTSRAEPGETAETAKRTVTATVVPGLEPRFEPGRMAWTAVPGAASYRAGGTLGFATTCDLVRRLVIREQGAEINTETGAGQTSITLPPSPGPEYELAWSTVSISAYDGDGVLLARGDLLYTRDFATCWYKAGEEPLLHVTPDAGSCIGDVTFTGERFPTGVNVEITMPPFGSDVSGPRVAVAPAATDGAFTVNATLPATACATASSFPGGQMAFFAYNADEPKGMTIFARAAYVASFPPGSERLVIIGPEAGSGPGAGGDASRCAAVLAVAGAGLTLAGLRWRRRDAATVGRRRE